MQAPSRRRRRLEASPRLTSWPRSGWLVTLAAIAASLLSGAAAADATGSDSQAPALLAAARTAASQDRNAESAALFAQAVAADPAVRPAVAREWADQLTWSGQSRLAASLYQEALASPGLPTEEVRAAHRGLAFALSLADALPAAEREYRTLLASDPQDLEAARHLARVRSWRGRQHEAIRRLQALMPELVGRPEWQHAMFDLARAQYWMGRPDRAQETLDSLLAAQPDHQGGKDLRSELTAAARPVFRAEAFSSSQSDDLRIRTATVEQELRWREGAGAGSLRLRRTDYAPRASGDIRVDRPGLFVRQRLGDRAELNLDLGLERIHQAASEVADRDLLTYDSWLTLWAGDTVRFDLGAKRATFDNTRSLVQGITAISRSLSVELTPGQRTRWSFKVEDASYSDGNHRRWGQAELAIRLRQNPEVRVGARVTALEFSQRLSNGYFNPADFVAAVVVAHAWGKLGAHAWWDLDGTWGREHAQPDGDKPTASAAAKLTWQARNGFELGARWDTFSSRLASSSGFSRNTFGFFARLPW